MGSSQAPPVAQHQQPATTHRLLSPPLIVCGLIMPIHIPCTHTRVRAPCIKIYRDKQHTRSICCLQLTHSKTTASSAAAWQRLWVIRSCIQFLNVLGGLWSPSVALLPPLLATQSAAMGQARRLNCQPATYIPALPRVTHGRTSVCWCHPLE